MAKRIKRKLKYRNIGIIFFLGLLIYSSYHICIWLIDNYGEKQEIEAITKSTKIETIQTEDAVVINTTPDYYNLYKDVDLINVDFEELLNTNNETKGWLKVNNTNINYPFVQHKDNDYYLNHTFNKKGNGGGWVFLDYRNNPNFEDFNTIIYGHGRKNKTIFGTLGYVLKENYISKKENQFIMISTPQRNLTYQIFSAYKIPNTSDYITTDFISSEEKNNFISMIKERSVLNIDVPVTSEDKLLTLSTCFNNDVKIVVHAKLVKYIER